MASHVHSHDRQTAINKAMQQQSIHHFKMWFTVNVVILLGEILEHLCNQWGILLMWYCYHQGSSLRRSEKKNKIYTPPPSNKKSHIYNIEAV